MCYTCDMRDTETCHALNIRNIPPDLMHDIKVRAATEGCSLRDWVILIFRAELKREAAEACTAQPVAVENRSVMSHDGIRRKSCKHGFLTCKSCGFTDGLRL